MSLPLEAAASGGARGGRLALSLRLCLPTAACGLLLLLLAAASHGCAHAEAAAHARVEDTQ